MHTEISKRFCMHSKDLADMLGSASGSYRTHVQMVIDRRPPLLFYRRESIHRTNINGHGESASASFHSHLPLLSPVHASSPCPDILNTEPVPAEARVGAPIATKPYNSMGHHPFASKLIEVTVDQVDEVIRSHQ